MIPKISKYIAVAAAFFQLAFAKDFPISEWNLTTYDGAFATMDCGTVYVVAGGSEFWHVQLTRSDIELKNGKTYEVKFSLQGSAERRVVDVRIGRNGFPYDAFAEFGEIGVTANERELSRTFTMNSGNVTDARFEFNLGKYSGAISISNVQLTCLDCSNQSTPSAEVTALSVSEWNYVIAADTVHLADDFKALGNVFGADFQLGADSKIDGDVAVSGNCFLRERAVVAGTLRSAKSCVEQNSVVAGAKESASALKPEVKISEVAAGISPISVGIGESLTLASGNYGIFYANAKARVKLISGVYNFQKFYTEPGVEFSFDLNNGPIWIGVQNDIRFGDRNQFRLLGGNPSEITWNVTGKKVDFGTDGLYFGKFLAPNAAVRLPSRSHVVGRIFAQSLIAEPQTTISAEPRAKEISHSDEHFGPFFDSEIFRYQSQLSLAKDSVEMFVYADSASVNMNGGNERKIGLDSPKTSVKISLSREKIPGFPAEAFKSEYVFDFIKNENYRVYWNPQTSCAKNCTGLSEETAIGDFSETLEIAQTTGKEIHMAGGTWNAAEFFLDSVVPWPVGFELVGNQNDLWNLTSEKELPLIDLGKKTHLEIEGKSPRSLVGFRIENGYSVDDGGAVKSFSQKLRLKTTIISSSQTKKRGGAIFAEDSLELEHVRFSKNAADEDGGAILANGEIKMLGVIFLENSAKGNGGAIALQNKAYIGNGIFYGNAAGNSGGALQNEGAELRLWNSTFFMNVAGSANGAVGGNATGEIGNSIFWKNLVTGCSSDDCSPEVVNGFSATNSSFSNSYAGANIFVGDPKLANEKNPAGANMYMDYDAGINLAENSPLLTAGIRNENVPQMDLPGENRGNSIPLGPYAFAWSRKYFSFGILNEDGVVIETKPSIPLISAISGDYYREYLATSPYARVFRATIKKSGKTNRKKAKVKFWLKNFKGEIYKDVPPVEFEVYQGGEERGHYVFQTMTAIEGKPVLFSKRPQDAGNFKDAIVLYMKSVSDYFYYEAE